MTGGFAREVEVPAGSFFGSYLALVTFSTFFAATALGLGEVGRLLELDIGCGAVFVPVGVLLACGGYSYSNLLLALELRSLFGAAELRTVIVALTWMVLNRCTNTSCRPR